MRTYLIVFVFILIPCAVFSQDPPTEDTNPTHTQLDLGTPIGRQWYLDFFLIQPNGFLYFDLGKDQKGRLDLFKDGNGKFGFQMLGADLLRGQKYKIGISTGLGISFSTNDSTETGSFFLWNIGVTFEISELIRLESGYTLGVSAKEDLINHSDYGIYLGLAFPTTLGKAIKKSL
jgi:hypothetical protein